MDLGLTGYKDRFCLQLLVLLATGKEAFLEDSLRQFDGVCGQKPS